MKPTDLPTRIQEFVHERVPMPFQWGPNDCGSFVLAWAKKMTGRDWAEVTWDSARTALEWIADHGGTLQAAADSVFGEPLHKPQQAQRGDVALVNIPVGDGSRDVLGVVTGEFVACPGEHGMVNIPRTAMIRAWRVE